MKSFTKYIIGLIAFVFSMLQASAGVNSGQADGYLDRGIFMYDASLDVFAFDQLEQYAILTGGDEQSDLLEALSAARSTDPMATKLLSSFLSKYPLSPSVSIVKLVLGNCYMDHSEWSRAIGCYEDIASKSLAHGLEACRCYNMGAAYIQLDNLREANRLMGRLDGSRYATQARFYRGYIAYRDEEYKAARTLLEGVSTDKLPGSMAPYYLCQIYYLQGDNDKALGMARRLIQTDIPLSYMAEVSRIAGESLYNLKEVDLAIPYLLEYIKDVDGEPLPSAMYILGMSRYETGDYREAIESLKAPSRLDDVMGQSALLTTGQSYMHLGDMSAAILALNKAVEMNLDPKITEEAFYNYCVARCDGGRVPFGNSVAVFEDFLERFPASRYATAVSEYLAFGYMNEDNYENALASINHISNPSSTILEARQHILYTLGSRDLGSGKYDSAINFLTQARDAAGNNRAAVNECNLLLADCYYKKADYKRATQLYTDYIAKGNVTDTNRTLALYDLGYSLFAQQKYSEAVTRFTQLLKINGLNASMKADAACRVGDCLYAAKDLQGALRSYDQAAQIDPSSADYPLYQKATILGWQGNQDALIDALNAMIARFPSSPLVSQALLDIAEAQTSAGRIDAALVTYRRVEKEFPSTAQCRQALLLMGSLLSERGRNGDAYDTYKRLIAGHSPSREATIGARYMQEVAADAGRLDEYVTFMKSVPNAPAVDPSEIDRITFTRAKNAVEWHSYLDRYPNGEFASQAMLLIAQDAASNEDYQEARAMALRLLEAYPAGEHAAGALAVKGDAEAAMGMTPEALESFKALEARASDSGTLNHARLGQLYASRDLAMYDDVIAVADRLLASSTLGTGQLTEVNFIKATALSNAERGEEAVTIWKSLAQNHNDLNGIKSLYYLGQYYFDNSDLTKAKEYADNLVDSNTPYSYWLARGYILVSDIYRARGDVFEADEYLKSLRENYPGSEPDIIQMIETRLIP